MINMRDHTRRQAMTSKFQGMRVLVTGGAGFIGSNLVTRLLEEGASVRVLDNLSTGRVENLNEVKDDIEFIQGDIRDADFLSKTLRGVEIVFHQATLPSVPRSVEDPLATHQVNATGTLVLLLSARKGGVKKSDICLVLLRLRGFADASQGGGHANQSKITLHPLQVRGRAQLPALHPDLRPGDCLPPIFQRLRTPPRSYLPVRGGHSSLHHRHPLR